MQKNGVNIFLVLFTSLSILADAINVDLFFPGNTFRHEEYEGQTNGEMNGSYSFTQDDQVVHASNRILFFINERPHHKISNQQIDEDSPALGPPITSIDEIIGFLHEETLLRPRTSPRNSSDIYSLCRLII